VLLALGTTPPVIAQDAPRSVGAAFIYMLFASLFPESSQGVLAPVVEADTIRWGY